MKSCIAVLGLLLGSAPLLAQDAVERADARDRADAARRKVAGFAVGTDATVGLAGSGTEFRLLVVVRDPVEKKALKDLVGGDRCDGIPILWSMRNSVAPAPPTAPPPPVMTVPQTPAAAVDATTLDCRRHWVTQLWFYTPPGWWRPWIVWEYSNGWNAHKLRRRDYGSGKIWWR